MLNLQYKTLPSRGGYPLSSLFLSFQTRTLARCLFVGVHRILYISEPQTTNPLPNLFQVFAFNITSFSFIYFLIHLPVMLFTTVLLALAAVGSVFSAPVPSMEPTRRQGSVDSVIERRHDALSSGSLHYRSKRLAPRWKNPERVQRAKRRGGGGGGGGGGKPPAARPKPAPNEPPSTSKPPPSSGSGNSPPSNGGGGGGNGDSSSSPPNPFLGGLPRIKPPATPPKPAEEPGSGPQTPPATTTDVPRDSRESPQGQPGLPVGEVVPVVDDTASRPEGVGIGPAAGTEVLPKAPADIPDFPPEDAPAEVPDFPPEDAPTEAPEFPPESAPAEAPDFPPDDASAEVPEFPPEEAEALPEAPPEDVGVPAEDTEAPAESFDPPAEDVEVPEEDVGAPAGDDGGEGASTIPDLLPRL